MKGASGIRKIKSGILIEKSLQGSRNLNLIRDVRSEVGPRMCCEVFESDEVDLAFVFKPELRT